MKIAKIISQEVREKSHLECEKCGWPVCSRACQENFYHANYECKFTIEQRGEKVIAVA